MYFQDPNYHYLMIYRAVVDATNNINNQLAFQIARAADPTGIRTVGVITKCDAIQAGDEDGVSQS